MAQQNSKIEELKARLELEPGSRIFFPLAEELRKAGQFEEAERVLREGIDNHPSYLSAWVSLGRVLAHLERHPMAIEAFKKALAMDPENVVAARLLAESYMAVGNKIEAIKKFKLVHAFLPTDQDVEAKIEGLERELNPDLYVRPIKPSESAGEFRSMEEIDTAAATEPLPTQGSEHDGLETAGQHEPSEPGEPHSGPSGGSAPPDQPPNWGVFERESLEGEVSEAPKGTVEIPSPAGPRPEAAIAAGWQPVEEPGRAEDSESHRTEEATDAAEPFATAEPPEGKFHPEALEAEESEEEKAESPPMRFQTATVQEPLPASEGEHEGASTPERDAPFADLSLSPDAFTSEGEAGVFEPQATSPPAAPAEGMDRPIQPIPSDRRHEAEGVSVPAPDRIEFPGGEPKDESSSAPSSQAETVARLEAWLARVSRKSGDRV